MTSPGKEIEKLKKEIAKHAKLYYELDSPQISDAEYDKLLARLKELEKKYPEYKSAGSPTQKIGGEPSKIFSPVEHNPPMLSLDNSYSAGDIKQWYERVTKTLKHKPKKLTAEAKIDGVSCSLTYKDGILDTAATRGNGFVGENITSNAKTIKSIPVRLKEALKGIIEIRGEVFIEKKDFENLNESQKQKGTELFANPRNAAAGSIRQKDPKITAQRKLKFFAHSFGKTQIAHFPTSQQDFLAKCSLWGFLICPVQKVCTSIEEVVAFYSLSEPKRNQLPYEIDGLVIKIDDFEERQKLGSTAKSPRWAMAFKYPAQQATTILQSVVFSVGRTGVITPIAKLKPVLCGGVTISNATLHNFDEIKRLKVKKGDTVLIERAGDVIPKIIKPLTEKRKGNESEIIPPQKCLVCSSNLFKEPEEVAYKCINPSCPAQIRGRLLHFASRNAMDIEGLGDVVVDQLLQKKFVKDFSDIYKLDAFKLLRLELFKNKKAANLLSAIEKSKTRPLEKVIYALGVPHVGTKTARIIAERFSNINDVISAKEEELRTIPDIGPVVAKSIKDFFANPKTTDLIGNLRRQGLNLEQPKKTAERKKLQGKTFVFTGELEKLTRSQAQELIEKLGGNFSSSVSAKTSFVVAGKSAGSKLEKAKKIGVKILNEEQFLKLAGK